MSELTLDIDAVLAGKARLTDGHAMELYAHPHLHELGQWANATPQRLHPADDRTYFIDRDINDTNVCPARRTFCAFGRDHDDAGS